MTRRPDVFIHRALSLSEELCELAREGEAGSDDLGCLALYGMIRDCGYQIREHAERQARLIERRERHRAGARTRRAG